MAEGDLFYIPKVQVDNEGRISTQNLNDIIRRIYQNIYALEGRTEPSQIRNDLTVNGSVTAESLAAEPFTLVYDKNFLTPPVLPDSVNIYDPDGYGAIWRLQTDNAFGISISAIVPKPRINGLRLFIINVGNFNITLLNASGFQYEMISGSGDVVLSFGGMAFLIWDDEREVWWLGKGS